MTARLSAIRRHLYETGYVTYICIAMWFGYFLAVPLVFAHSFTLGVLAAIFPGAYIGTWTIWLMHECDHRYFTTINHKRMLVTLSSLLFTQPSGYVSGHRAHHRLVNTYEDREIHPIGRIGKRLPRALYFSGQCLFGSLFLFLFGLGHDAEPRYKAEFNDRLMPLVWIAIWGSVAIASHFLTGASWATIGMAYLVSIWATSFIHRHNEMMEHGGVIVHGDMPFRAKYTRNLAPRGLLSKLFLFIVHQDSREHHLHHTRANINWRPDFSRERLSEDRAYITLGEYVKLMLKMMTGYEPPEVYQGCAAD